MTGLGSYGKLVLMTSTAKQYLENTLASLTDAEKLELIEQLARSVRAAKIPAASEPAPPSWPEFFDEMRRLPVVNAADGWSARDHDKILYGSEK